MKQLVQFVNNSKLGKADFIQEHTVTHVGNFDESLPKLLDDLIYSGFNISYTIIEDEVTEVSNLYIREVDNEFNNLLKAFNEYSPSNNSIVYDGVGHGKLIEGIKYLMETPLYKSINDITFEFEPMLILKGNKEIYRYSRN